MKRYLILLVVLFTLFVSGCGKLSVIIHTTLNLDGSITQQIETRGEGVFGYYGAETADELQKEGWGVKTKQEGDATVQTATKRFDPKDLKKQVPTSFLNLGASEFLLSPHEDPSSEVMTVNMKNYLFLRYYDCEVKLRGWETGKPTICSSCGGSGKEICSSCGGSGRGKCLYCGGTGQAEDPWEGLMGPCHICGGSGRAQCSACEGTGKIDCFFCGGTGKAPEIETQAYELAKRMVSVTYKLTVPGRILESNADELNDKKDTATWFFTVDDIERGRSISVFARYVNWRLIAILGVILIIVATTIVILVLRKSRIKTIEVEAHGDARTGSA